MALLRVNLHSANDSRGANYHDDDVARGLVQADHVSMNESDQMVSESPSNNHRSTNNSGNEHLNRDLNPPHISAGGQAGSSATMVALSDSWQQIEWTLMPYAPVGRAIVSATQRLEDGGSSTANLDAQVILAHVLGVDRSWLFAHYDYELMPAEAKTFSELVARRTAAEPVAYLVGKKEFYGLELTVDKRVLIPRPETELLVDAVLDHIESRPNKHVLVADAGTGSGAIALAVAVNCEDAAIFATDISEEAILVARENLARLDTRRQVTLLQGDLLRPLPGKVDVVAANLPYIRRDEYQKLMRDVRDYEPQLALEAGPDGLDTIKRLLWQIPDYLDPGGVFFLEIGHDQGEPMIELVERLIPGIAYVNVRQDYHGQDRLLVAAL